MKDLYKRMSTAKRAASRFGQDPVQACKKACVRQGFMFGNAVTRALLCDHSVSDPLKDCAGIFVPIQSDWPRVGRTGITKYWAGGQWMIPGRWY